VAAHEAEELGGIPQRRRLVPSVVFGCGEQDCDRKNGHCAKSESMQRDGDGSSAYAPVMQPPPTAPCGPQPDTGAAPTICMVNPARAEGAAA
jgi:hypothetical protein